MRRIDPFQLHSINNEIRICKPQSKRCLRMFKTQQRSLSLKNSIAQNRIQIVIVTKTKIEHMVSKKTQTLDTNTTASLSGVGTWSAIIEKEIYYLLDVTCFVSASLEKPIPTAFSGCAAQMINSSLPL